MRERGTRKMRSAIGIMTVIEGEKAKNYVVFDELNIVDEVKGGRVRYHVSCRLLWT